METVNLTPAGFDPSNPNAATNVANAEKAADELSEVLRQKAEFLRELVDDYFGGIDDVYVALRKHLREKGARAEQIAEASEVLRRWKQLKAQHDAAGEKLLRAVAGA